MDGTTEQLKNDKSFNAYHEWGVTIALPVICPICGEITWFDDRNIPNSEKYEISCDNCKALILRNYK